MILLPEPKSVRHLEGACATPGPPPRVQREPALGREAYRLLIAPDGIHITHGGDAGLHYARQTLGQIRMQCPGALPCLEIDDAPALPERGFMLDISRCKVPTLKSLKHVADVLASLKMNQLQLYMEHAFAYAGHETAWENASPLTGAEVRELDAYCRSLHIELVPNQNSFGHMERWLRHGRYKHLAECPDGFIHPVDGSRRACGSTLRPDDASLEFVSGLFDELLPNFTSGRFNIGCDETWELGNGWSKPLVDARGKGRVYLEHVTRIAALANAHGREALYWADGLLSHPELIADAPANACPVIWGYEADHPLAEQGATLAAAGLPFYVAPGDSTWNSFTGRLHTARANIEAAAHAARINGARGLIHTHWGDNGHPQTWTVALPGLLLAANASWNPDAPGPCLAEALARFIFKDASLSAGHALIALGGLDAALDIPVPNRSFLFEAFNAPMDKLASHLQLLTDKKIESAHRILGAAQEHIHAAKPAASDATLLAEELQLAHDMSAHALARAKLIRDNMSTAQIQGALDELKARYASIWQERNRPGGLDESLRLFNP